MPSIVYDNVQYIPSKDAIQCKKCLIVIKRNARDHFKWCSCRTIGIETPKGNVSDLCRYFAMDGKEKVWLMETYLEKMVDYPPTSFT